MEQRANFSYKNDFHSFSRDCMVRLDLLCGMTLKSMFVRGREEHLPQTPSNLHALPVQHATDYQIVPPACGSPRGDTASMST